MLIPTRPAAALPATHFTFGGIDDPITEDRTDGTFSITARDTNGAVATGYTGTVTFSSDDPGAEVLPANYTFVAGDNSTKTFPGVLKWDTPGERTLTVTDTANASITGSLSAITVRNDAPTNIVLFQVNDPITEARAESFDIAIRNAFNENSLQAAGYTVAFTSTDGAQAAADRPSNYTFVAGDGGFKGGLPQTWRTPGEHTLTVTGTKSGFPTISGSQGNITVRDDAPTTILFFQVNDPITENRTDSFDVAIRNAHGENSLEAAGYTVAFSSSDGAQAAGDRPPNLSFVAGDFGFKNAITPLMWRTPGEHTLTGTGTKSGFPTISGSQANITVRDDAPTTIVFLQVNDPITENRTDSFDVAIRNAHGENSLEAGGYTVAFTSTDGAQTAGDRPANYTFVVADNGSKVSLTPLIWRTPGEHTLTATGTRAASPTITGAQANVTARDDSPTTLAIELIQDPIFEEQPEASFQVRAVNAFAETSLEAGGHVINFTSTDPQATMPPSFTYVAGDNGVKVLTNALIWRTVGEQTLTATDSANGSLTGNRPGITVQLVNPTKFVLEQVDDPIQVDQFDGTFRVRATDASNNTAPGYTGTITFTSNDPGAETLPGNYTFQASDHGVKDFPSALKWATVGERTLTVGDGTRTGSQSAITVTAAPAAPGGKFNPLVPARILDSRSGAPAVDDWSTKWPSDTTRTVQVAGRGGVPAGASAVALNVTALNATSGGWLTVFPSDVANPPNASNLNFTPGKVVPNLVIVKLAPDGFIKIYNSPTGTTDVFADVVGYFGNETASTDGRYISLPPARVLDSRSTVVDVVDDWATAWPANTARDVVIAGRGGVPADAIAVALNVTVTQPTANSGYMTIWPTGAAQPGASNLNWDAGQTVPNRVFVKLGVGTGNAGKISIYNSAGSTEVIADVVGYFTSTAAASSSTGIFHPIAPVRLLDSRPDQTGPPDPYTTPWAANTQRSLNIANVLGLPAALSGIVLNMTVTNPTTPFGWLTVFPTGAPPNASDLNFVPGLTVANLAPVKVHTDGTIQIYNSPGGTTDVIADATGYFS